jgi:hypothetical protein
MTLIKRTRTQRFPKIKAGSEIYTFTFIFIDEKLIKWLGVDTKNRVGCVTLNIVFFGPNLYTNKNDKY